MYFLVYDCVLKEFFVVTIDVLSETDVVLHGPDSYSRCVALLAEKRNTAGAKLPIDKANKAW